MTLNELKKTIGEICPFLEYNQYDFLGESRWSIGDNGIILCARGKLCFPGGFYRDFMYGICALDKSLNPSHNWANNYEVSINDDKEIIRLCEQTNLLYKQLFLKEKLDRIEGDFV